MIRYLFQHLFLNKMLVLNCFESCCQRKQRKVVSKLKSFLIQEVLFGLCLRPQDLIMKILVLTEGQDTPEDSSRQLFSRKILAIGPHMGREAGPILIFWLSIYRKTKKTVKKILGTNSFKIWYSLPEEDQRKGSIVDDIALYRSLRYLYLRGRFALNHASL